MPDWYASMVGMPLTDRERQVLDTLATDCTEGQIAAALGCSRSAVKTHRQSLYRKFGVHSRIGLLNAAGARGML